MRNRIRSKVLRKLPRKNGNDDNFFPEGELGNRIGFIRRISGVVSYCNSCHRPVLPSVFPFVYCGFCNSHQVCSDEMAEIHLEDGEEKQENNS